MARRAALLATLLLPPSLAAAQATPGAGAVTVVESADSTEVNPPYINITECDGTTSDTLTYYWNPSASASSYELWIADQPTTISSPALCPPSSTSVTAHSARIATVQTGTTNKQDDQTVQTRLSQISVSCTGTVTTVYFCMNVAGQTDQIAATGSLALDLGVPSTPTGLGLVAGDTVLHASWSAGSGGTGTTTGYRVYWGPHSGSLQSHDLTGSGTTTYDISGLTNGDEYDVQVSALSAGKNESDRTAIATGTPVPVLDFWRLYKTDGGHEEGGCAGGAAGLGALLALLPLALCRRRS